MECYAIKFDGPELALRIAVKAGRAYMTESEASPS
jgi:hypothetical protein